MKLVTCNLKPLNCNPEPQTIEMGLELKYGVEGLKLLERINEISAIEKLEAIKEAVKISKNMEEIEKLL